MAANNSVSVKEDTSNATDINNNNINDNNIACNGNSSIKIKGNNSSIKRKLLNSYTNKKNNDANVSTMRSQNNLLTVKNPRTGSVSKDSVYDFDHMVGNENEHKNDNNVKWFRKKPKGYQTDNSIHKFYVTRLKHSLIISFLLLIAIQNIFLSFLSFFSGYVRLRFIKNKNY
jgi:hypothetical protein